MERNDREFFNALAESWDKTRARDPARLRELTARTGISPGDTVLDIGCGTGVLIPFLRERVGDSGCVLGIDIADNMVKIAADKFARFDNVAVRRADIMEFSTDCQFQQVTCLNFFPHIQDRPAFLRKVIGEWLAPGGTLHVFHDISRARVNAIHGESKTVKEDRLPPCGEVGELFRAAGFIVEVCFETDESYFVQGRKPATPVFLTVPAVPAMMGCSGMHRYTPLKRRQ